MLNLHRYGDRAPLSFKGRLFAMAWIYFGLIVISITMAMVTTALTTVTLKSASTLYGSKVNIQCSLVIISSTGLCRVLSCVHLLAIKGTMPPQAHVRVDGKHYEIVGPTFSNTIGEFRKLFSSVLIALICGKFSDSFIYKRS